MVGDFSDLVQHFGVITSPLTPYTRSRFPMGTVLSASPRGTGLNSRSARSGQPSWKPIESVYCWDPLIEKLNPIIVGSLRLSTLQMIQCGCCLTLLKGNTTKAKPCRRRICCHMTT